MIDVLALNQECLRWGVEPHQTCTVESAHELLKVLPCGVPRRGELGDIIELDARIRRAHGNRWSMAIGDRIEFVGSFEGCVTRIAQACTPPERQRQAC